MADFMSDHPGLAKGKISNCPEGRASSNRLWEQLTTKLWYPFRLKNMCSFSVGFCNPKCVPSTHPITKKCKNAYIILF